jgi:TPR repeat protein
MTNLALIGQMNPIDSAGYREAIALLRRAASKAEPTAQLLLGRAYFDGKGVPRLPAVGFLLTLRAAQAGLPAAQLAVGGAYGEGRGTPRDLVQARLWLERATSSTNQHVSEAARQALGRLEQPAPIPFRPAPGVPTWSAQHPMVTALEMHEL